MSTHCTQDQTISQKKFRDGEIFVCAEKCSWSTIRLLACFRDSFHHYCSKQFHYQLSLIIDHFSSWLLHLIQIIQLIQLIAYSCFSLVLLFVCALSAVLLVLISFQTLILPWMGIWAIVHCWQFLFKIIQFVHFLVILDIICWALLLVAWTMSGALQSSSAVCPVRPVIISPTSCTSATIVCPALRVHGPDSTSLQRTALAKLALDCWPAAWAMTMLDTIVLRRAIGRSQFIYKCMIILIENNISLHW